MAADVATYIPSENYIKAFWDRETTRRKVDLELPDGFPDRLDSSLAWTGEQAGAKASEWTLTLNEEEVAAVNSALENFEAKYDDLSMLSQRTFELPAAFSLRLRKLSDQLYEGVGFQIIRGLEPSNYTPRQALIVYAGVSGHICPERGFTDVKGQSVIAHIVNVQAGGTGPKTTAPAFTDSPLSFHTDNCEIMAFFYMEPAAKGGETILSSLWQTYNELAAARSDLIHTLSKPWVFDRYGMLGWQRKRNPELPRTTQAQVDAADAIQFICMKNSLKLQTRKGDILLVNDMAVIHARQGFEEDESNAVKRRHLVKMHLRDPEKGWSIPAALENEWKTVYSLKGKDKDQKEIWDVYHESGLEEMSSVNG